MSGVLVSSCLARYAFEELLSTARLSYRQQLASVRRPRERELCLLVQLEFNPHPTESTGAILLAPAESLGVPGGSSLLLDPQGVMTVYHIRHVPDTLRHNLRHLRRLSRSPTADDGQHSLTSNKPDVQGSKCSMEATGRRLAICWTTHDFWQEAFGARGSADRSSATSGKVRSSSQTRIRDGKKAACDPDHRLAPGKPRWCSNHRGASPRTSGRRGTGKGIATSGESYGSCHPARGQSRDDEATRHSRFRRSEALSTCTWFCRLRLGHVLWHGFRPTHQLNKSHMMSNACRRCCH